MRLADIVNQFRRSFSEVTTIVRYPVEMAKQAARRRFQNWYDSAQFPERRKQPESSHEQPTETRELSAVSTDRVNQTEQIPPQAAPGKIPQKRELQDCYLAPGTVIKSRWNSYTAELCVEETKRTRLYRGINRSNEPILIKEYQLSDRDFNLREIEERQKAFERLIELNVKIGNGPDFRLIKLVDAIVFPKEHCCYLITKPINHNTTLESYLSKRQALPAKEIRIILQQILQTLHFLHVACRVYFPTGESERGLPHGNLSLRSLLIRQLASDIPHERPFFIYLTDLTLWEHLFHPLASPMFREKVAKSSRDLGTVEKDLADLASIGFRLTGGIPDSISNQAIEFQTDPAWQKLDDAPLKQFIEQLRGGKFVAAEEALQALCKLPQPTPAVIESPASEVSTDKETAPRRLLPIALLGIGALGLLSWWVGRQMTIPVITQKTPELTSPVTTIDSVESVPASLTYAVEPEGAWEYALDRTFIPYTLTPNATRQNLIAAIQERYRNYGLELDQRDLENDRRSMIAPRQQLLESIASGRVQVGFVRLDNDIANYQLYTQPVAYDALVILVPFVDPYRAKDTVGKIGRVITKDELIRLYTGDTDTPKFHGQTVKLFFPEVEETIDVFHTLVLKNDPELIAKFTALRKKAEQRDQTLTAGINNNIYEKMLVDFETNNGEAIGIGFDRLSRAFGQCSVYPLAIREGMQSISPLVQYDDQPINENIDLCGAKGSYFPNVEQYPLKYDLGVVFSKSNLSAGQKLAEILDTTEGQYLISEVGLVPEQPVQEVTSVIWKSTDE